MWKSSKCHLAAVLIIVLYIHVYIYIHALFCFLIPLDKYENKTEQVPCWENKCWAALRFELKWRCAHVPLLILHWPMHSTYINVPDSKHFSGVLENSNRDYMKMKKWKLAFLSHFIMSVIIRYWLYQRNNHSARLNLRNLQDIFVLPQI